MLFVQGTPGPDLIVVSVVAAPGRRGPLGSVMVQGVGSFPASKVHLIAIAAGDGDDGIVIQDTNRWSIPALIDGGAGNDVILGGSNNDVILGGPGNDVIFDVRGHNTLLGGPGLNLIDGQFDGTLPAPLAPVPVTPPPAPAPAPQPTVSESVIEQATIDLINQQRSLNGLAPLKLNSKLVQAAQIHARDMAQFGIMEHDIPQATLPTLISRLNYVGYNYAFAGENIAFNYADAPSVVNGWMNSPGHRANILNVNFTEVGAGVALDSSGQPYYCMVFGEPM